MNAVVVQFPAKVQRKAKRRLDHVELDARWHWMLGEASKWETTKTDGVEYQTRKQQQFWALLDEQDGVKPATVAEKRKDVAKYCKLIEKRNRVKTWLASLGADLDDITTPEQALFFAFDRLHERELPTSA